MDLSWIGTTLVALAGLFAGVFGVVFGSRTSARVALARQQFEAEQAEIERRRVERERIYDSVKQISDELAQAEYWTNYETPAWDFGQPYDFSDHFPDWLEGRREQLRQQTALIPQAPIRIGLQTCIESITYAWGIEDTISRPAIKIIREASQVGFELTTAWLRDQEPNEAVMRRLSEVDRTLGLWKSARVRAEMEARDRANGARPD